MQGKAANFHVLPGMIREIKVSSDCFGCVFVISFYVTKAFSRSLVLSLLFSDIFFTLRMKGQVLHSERAYLKVPD